MVVGIDVGLSGGLFICPLSDPGNALRDFSVALLAGKIVHSHE
jgi:hypothetical protein